MKKHQLIIALAFFICSIACFADVPKALFVYGKDNKTSAFFYNEIEKMTVSRMDTNGIEQERFMTQEIHTLDSIYRIPLADIDSITFHPLPTILQPGVERLSAEFEKYILSLDEFDIYVCRSIPSYLLPEPGAMIISTTISENQPYGIRSKVTGIEYTSDDIIIRGEELALTDAYYNLCDAYTLESYCEINEEGKAELKMREKKDNLKLDFDKNVFYSFDPINIDTNMMKMIFNNFGLEPLEYEDIQKISSSFDINVKFDKFDITITPSISYNVFISIQPKWELQNMLLPLIQLQTSGRINLDLNIESEFNINGSFTAVTPINFDSSQIKPGITNNNIQNFFYNAKDKHGIWFEAKAGAYLSFNTQAAMGGSAYLPLSIPWRFNHTWNNPTDFTETHTSFTDPKDKDSKLFGNSKWNMDKTSKRMHIDWDYSFGRVGMEFGGIVEIGAKIGVFDNFFKQLFSSDSEHPVSLGASVGLAAGIGFQSDLPLYLNNNSVNKRDTGLYTSLINHPSHQIYAKRLGKVSAGIYMNLRKDSLFKTKLEFDKSWGDDNIVLGQWDYVPEFTLPQLTESEDGVLSIGYYVNGKLINPHDVGIVIYDTTNEEDITHDIYYNMNPYQEGEYDHFDIILSHIKPNHRYVIYPCVDQKAIFTDEPIPILAEPAYTFRLKVTPVTGEMLSFDNDNMAATCSGIISDFKHLKNTIYQAGIAICNNPNMENPMFHACSIKSNGEFSDKIYSLNPSTTYYFAAYLKCGEDDPIFGDMKSFSTPMSEEVDLGLSVNWCSHNIGCENPEEIGRYYAWGENMYKGFYSWDTYFDNPYDSSGNWMGCSFSSDITEAANHPCPGKWSMPTRTEMDELINECEWEWTEYNGTPGYKVTGPSGASIFLPAGGLYDGNKISNPDIYGGYWTSTINPNNTTTAANLMFMNSGIKMLQWSNRFYGRLIRAVCAKSF